MLATNFVHFMLSQILSALKNQPACNVRFIDPASIELLINPT